VTGRHRGPKRKRTFVCRYMAPPGECYYNTVLCCTYYFSSSSVVLHLLFVTVSVLCVYSMFGHHPHPLGYLCAKFCLFCGLHCWVSLRRKIANSVTQLIWYPGNQSDYTSEKSDDAQRREMSTKITHKPTNQSTKQSY